MNLNRNRILGRLGSPWYQPQFDRDRAKDLLSKRLQECERFSACMRRNAAEVYAALSAQLDAFDILPSRTEGDNPSAEFSLALNSIIEKISLLLDGDISFRERFPEPGSKASDKEVTLMKDLDKIANYWRISNDLAECCRSYRCLFWNLTLSIIPHHEPTVIGRKKRHVHAEIQTVVYYETHPNGRRPRAIGSSKEACFLCDAFVKAHGQFYLSKSHRQVYPQWTVPELKEYSHTSILLFRETLRKVDMSMREEMNRTKKRHNLFPIQSSINLDKVNYLAPSLTTLAPSDASTIRAAPSLPVLLRDEPGTLCKDSADSGTEQLERVDSALTPTVQEATAARDQHVTPELEKNPKASTMTPDAPIHLRMGWLSLHTHLEAHRGVSGNTRLHEQSAPKRFSHGSISIETVDRGVAGVGKCIDIDDLMPGEEVVLPVSDKMENCLRFTMIHPQKGSVKVQCQWHS